MQPSIAVIPLHYAEPPAKGLGRLLDVFRLLSLELRAIVCDDGAGAICELSSFLLTKWKHGSVNDKTYCETGRANANLQR